MLKTEIAEVMQQPGKMFEIAEKVDYKLNLSAEEKEIYEISDNWCKEIGKSGHDRDHEIAAFITKTVNEEVYNAPDELLDMIFERGSIGEFDEVEYEKTVKNTLVAHEAAKGGTVDRSFLDFTRLKPYTKNYQVETDISYTDLRRGGFKSVATLTTFIKEALQNKLFYDVFAIFDAAIVGGEQVILAGSAMPTQAAIDAFNLYLLDRDTNAVAVTLSKYAQALGRMDGRTQYLSNEMKNDFNRYGLVDFIDGVKVASISGAKKTAKNQLLLPDKRIFGISGKIGNLDMKGEIHTYENEDNYNEKIILQVKDFTASVAITDPTKVAKIVLD